MILDDWEAKWCWQTENGGQKVNSQRQHCDVGWQETEVKQKLQLQLQCLNGFDAAWSANHKLLSLVNKVNPPSIKAGTNQFSKLTSPASISTSVRLDCQDERRSLFSTNYHPTSYQPTAINRPVEERRTGESFYNLFPQTINFLLLTTLALMMNITTFLCTDWKTRFKLSNRQSRLFSSSI